MNKGVAIAVASALLFTASALLTRSVFANHDINALSYVVTFSLASGACGLLGLTLNPEPAKFKSKNFKYVVIMGLLGVTALSMITFSLSLTTATNRNVLSTLIIITTALWSVPVLNHKISKSFFTWAAVLLGAVYLVLAGFSSIELNKGDALVILAVTIFGAGNALGQRLIPEFGSGFIINFRMVLGAIILVVVGTLFNSDNPLLITSVGVIPLLAGVLRFANIFLAFKAMNYLSATKVLTVTTVQIVFTILGAWIFLQEDITALKVLGSLIVVFSVYKIVQTKEQTQ